MAPLQGLSRLRAQRSVSPPMLSRIKSNLEVKRSRVDEKKRHKQIYIHIGRICECKKKRMAGQIGTEEELNSEYD